MALGQMTASMLGLGPQTPEAPEYDPVMLNEVLTETTRANIQNLPRIERLANRLNDFNVAQDLSTLEELFPGARAIMEQASSNIQSQLRGELPKDVEEQIRRYGAEAGVGSGTSGSEFAGARTARDLGLTSLTLEERGLSSAERWIAQSRSRVPLFNAASMFISPAMGLQNAQFNTTNQWNVDWLQAQLEAKGEVWEQYAMDSIKQVDDLAFSAASFYAGGGMGGGGAGGMMGMFGGGGSGGPPAGSTYPGYGGQYMSAPTSGGGISYPMF